MLKKVFIYVFVLGFFLLSPYISMAATKKAGCCVLQFDKTYDHQSEPIKTYWFKDGATPDQCREWGKSSLLETFYVEDFSTQCNSSEQANVNFRGNWCCKESGWGFSYSGRSSRGELKCTPIRYNTACSSGTLYKYSCNSISECSNSKTVLKDNFANGKLIQQEYEKLIKRIQNEQIKPTLSTELPGFKGFSDITVTKLTDENGKLTGATGGTRYLKIDWIAQFIEWIYNYAIGIAGIVATVMLMVGGFNWILSGGDINRVNQAKEYIKSSVLGLVIVMSAYMILNFVNPALTSLQSLYIEIPSASITAGEFPECQINMQKNPKPVAVNGGVFCADFTDTKKYVNLQDKKTDLPKITVPKTKNKAYVTISMFNKLKKINDILEKDERIVIGNTSRDLNDQVRYCNCWMTRKSSNFTVPCPTGCGSCNFAPGPACGSGGHRQASAADLWITGTNSKLGKLECGAASMENNCADHISDPTSIRLRNASNDCKDKIDPATKKVLEKNKHTICQNRLKEVMNKGGAKEIKSEWWHYEF